MPCDGMEANTLGRHGRIGEECHVIREKARGVRKGRRRRRAFTNQRKENECGSHE